MDGKGIVLRKKPINVIEESHFKDKANTNLCLLYMYSVFRLHDLASELVVLERPQTYDVPTNNVKSRPPMLYSYNQRCTEAKKISPHLPISYTERNMNENIISCGRAVL